MYTYNICFIYCQISTSVTGLSSSYQATASPSYLLDLKQIMQSGRFSTIFGESSLYINITPICKWSGYRQIASFLEASSNLGRSRLEADQHQDNPTLEAQLY